MRNLILLASVPEVEEFALSRFKTDRFRNSDLVRELVHRFAAVPRVFAQMSDPSIEWSHFSTWFNLFTLRNYDNDTINDLYWFHEFTHGTDLEYWSLDSFESWRDRMIEQEFHASVMSECKAYFLFPGLRKDSFSFEIWIDRFLGRPYSEALWFEIVQARRNVMNSDDLSALDKPSRQIALYKDQNLAWGDVWNSSSIDPCPLIPEGQEVGVIFKPWAIVESHMRNFVLLSKKSRWDALLEHVNWLHQMSSPLPNGDPIPFRKQAQLFAQICKGTKKKASNEVLFNASK